MSTTKKYNFGKIIIIYNPNSTGNATLKAKRLYQRLRNLEYDCQIIVTNKSKDAEQIAFDVANNFSKMLIISVSGDGGYHEVINGVMREINLSKSAKKIVCAVEAAGNANDHYHQMRGESLYKAIKNLQPKEMELIKVILNKNKPDSKILYAHSYVGWGLTPYAIKELNRQNLNPINEKVITAKQIIDFCPVKMRYLGKKQLVNNIIVAKVGRMSKIIKIDNKMTYAPEGTFRLLIDDKATKASIIKTIVTSITRGLQDDSNLARNFSCTMMEDTLMQMDGEVYELKKNTTVKVSIDSGKILTL